MHIQVNYLLFIRHSKLFIPTLSHISPSFILPFKCIFATGKVHDLSEVAQWMTVVYETLCFFSHLKFVF